LNDPPTAVGGISTFEAKPVCVANYSVSRRSGRMTVAVGSISSSGHSV
jgi:hypothetical protein